MIIAVIVVAVIVALVLWVIFIPVSIRVDTQAGLYEIRQMGTITMSMHPGEAPLIRMRVLGFPIDTQSKEEDTKTTKKTRTQRQKKPRSFRAWVYLFRGIVKSFKCKRFICNIDFDDVVVNAQLFPVACFVSRGPVVFSINFERRYQLDIWIQVQIHRMAWALTRFYFTK